MTLKVHKLSELLSLEQPDILYYIQPQLLSFAGTMFIYGRAATFKSWLAIEMMHSLATGKRWLIYLNGSEKPITSMMMQAEQNESMYQDRMLDYTKERIENPGVVDDYMYFATSQNLKLDDLRGQGQLEQVIKKARPQVVFIDCLYRVIKSATDTNSIGTFLDYLTYLTVQYGVAFVIVHHPRKESDEDRGFDELTGWSGIANWADTILRVTRKDVRNGDNHQVFLQLRWEKTKNNKEEVSDVDLEVRGLRFLTR